MNLLHAFAGIGIVTTAVIVLAFGYYIVTRRPTPNATVWEAVTSIRWSLAVAFFIVPPTVAGYQEGAPLLGFILGSAFVVFVLVLQCGGVRYD